ncbi:MAG: ribbon-helix-helix domain-containing protein [Gammaproteobacteria bacterium]
MARLNIDLDPEFQENLEKLMRLRGIDSKSEAVRVAVKEAVARETGQKPKTNWRAMLGWANQFPENPNPRFKSHGELWVKDS